jgi:hypothetical protein
LTLIKAGWLASLHAERRSARRQGTEVNIHWEIGYEIFDLGCELRKEVRR